MDPVVDVLPVLDLAALLWFAVCWIGYTAWADRFAWRRRPMATVLHDYRVTWMEHMLERDNRVADVQIVSAYIRTGALFASTTILIVAGVVTILGAVDKARAIVSTLSFAVPASKELWEIKVLVLLIVFVYGFFKFAWCIRQFNYALVMIGAAPMPDKLTDEDVKTYPVRAARIVTRGVITFNRGLRTYYFGLALLAWFIHPALFMAAAVWVLAVLYRRDFHSITLRTISGELGDPGGRPL